MAKAKAVAAPAEVGRLNEATLGEIVAFAKRQVELEELIETMTTSLQDLNGQLQQVAEVDLPAAMKEARLTEFTLDTGEKIKINEDFRVGIKAEDRDRAFDWLEARGFGGLIKTNVIAAFGKGELDRAQALLAALQKKKLICDIKREIPWQTLKAFIKEQTKLITKKTKKEDRIPMALFGAEAFNKAVVKTPKAKKGAEE